eukprot:53578-Eustigmatos_ZCMA.PRE.1
MPPKGARRFKTPVLKDPSAIPTNSDVPAWDQNIDKKSLFARLSRAAYGKEPPPEGWSKVEGSRHNDRNKTLYTNGQGKYALAFRGTDLTNKRNRMADLGADALLAIGAKRLSSRFRGAARTTKAVAQE